MRKDNSQKPSSPWTRRKETICLKFIKLDWQAEQWIGDTSTSNIFEFEPFTFDNIQTRHTEEKICSTANNNSNYKKYYDNNKNNDNNDNNNKNDNSYDTCNIDDYNDNTIKWKINQNIQSNWRRTADE